MPKIPKTKVVRRRSADGVEYLEEVEVSAPLLRYVAATPLRLYRTLIFELRIRGLLKMPAVPGHQGEPTDAANAPTVTTITVGTLRSASQRFSTPDTSGRYSVRLEFEHPDQVDGTDAIAIDWQPDGESPYTTHHTPDQLLRWLIQQAPGLSARFGGQLAEAEAEAFSTHLLLKEAKALLDDRTYERITVSGQEIEIRLKYLGLTVSLAALEDEAGSVLALLSGILGPDRHLEQVIVKVPLALLMRSTARHDSEEDAWVAVTPSE